MTSNRRTPRSLFEEALFRLCDHGGASIAQSPPPPPPLIVSLLSSDGKNAGLLPVCVVDRMLAYLADNKQSTSDLASLLLSQCGGSSVTTLPLCGSNVTFGSLTTRGIDALRPGLVELDDPLQLAWESTIAHVLEYNRDICRSYGWLLCRYFLF